VGRGMTVSVAARTDSEGSALLFSWSVRRPPQAQ
jgi:hypothetical protein